MAPDPHLESLSDRNIAITTRMVTHPFELDHILDTYNTFGRAAKTRVLKVIIET